MAHSITEQRLLAATNRYLIARGGDGEETSLDDAVCQDLMIFGVDVEDYVEVLEEEFGQLVWSIPWAHYTDQRGSYRGVAACLVAPILIPWMLLRRAILGPSGLNAPKPREHPYRLTLKEIVSAIDAGGWPKDWAP